MKLLAFVGRRVVGVALQGGRGGWWVLVAIMSSSRVERGEKHPSAYMENAGKTQLLLTSKCFLLQKAQSGCENDFSQFSHLISKKTQ